MPRRPTKRCHPRPGRRLSTATVPPSTINAAKSSTTSAPSVAGRSDPSGCKNNLGGNPSFASPTALGPGQTAQSRPSFDKPFPFLALPSELRVKVYASYFHDTDKVLDLGPENQKRVHKLLRLMRVCRQIHDEATHFFYSTKTFRIFPTHPGRYFKTKKPLLARLKAGQRALITSLELRLGPGWNAPPRGWVVNDALGLKDCTRVRLLHVFVECDPSDGAFKGFRRSEGFYEGFSSSLLDSVMGQLPLAKAIEFDAWPSVKKSGAMMHKLLKVAAQSTWTVRWGPIRGWTDVSDGGDSHHQQQDGRAVMDAVAASFADSLSIHGYAPNVMAAA